MKLSTYLKNIFPSMAVNIGLLALPVILSVYFVVTQYSDRFVVEQNISYFDVQNNWLGQVFLDQQWVGWFNRFMDFALWGLVAIAVLVGIWMVSSAKIAMKNHYAEESFTNFNVPKNTWHSQFFVVAFLKVMLVIAILYSLLSIIGRLVPRLSVDISIVLQEFSWIGIKTVLITSLYIVLFQFVIATCIKVFKHLQAE